MSFNVFALALVAFLTMGCGSKNPGPGASTACAKNADCQSGYLCLEQQCIIDTTPLETTIDSAPNSETTARTATFEFSCSKPSCYFRCKLDSEPFQACTSPKVYDSLFSGEHAFEVFAIDALGHEEQTAARHEWSVVGDDNRLPPDTFILSGPEGVRASTGATFTFSCNEDDCSFQCRLDDGVFTACTSPKSYSGLEDGEHTFRVRAIDRALNVDATPALRSWSIDTSAGKVPAPSTVLLATASVELGGFSNSANADFEFGCESDICTFQCSLNGGGFAACLVQHTFENLEDGAYVLLVFGVAADGTPDPAPLEWSWVVDTKPPVSTIVSGPSPIGWHSSAVAIFDFTAIDPFAPLPEPLGAVAAFECRLGDAPFSPCTPPVTLEALDDGTHTFQVRAIDLAGNVEPSPAARTWRIDTEPPITTITAAPEHDSTVSTATFMFACNEPGCVFECSLNGASRTPCTSPRSYAGLFSGQHSFEVVAKDRAGNVELLAPIHSWTVTLALSWTALAAGKAHACAIDASASLWCFGHNSHGQVGVAGAMLEPLPLPVPGDNDWLAVDAGEAFTCGLRHEPDDEFDNLQRSLWCFGDNAFGQLGQGTSGGQSAAALSVQDSTSWADLSVGGQHACAIQENGDGERTLWCWGRNNHGQLGLGALAAAEVFEPTQVGEHSDWLSVAAGSTFTCARRQHDAGGSLWCFGQGSTGRLGLGHNDSQSEPTKVAHDDWLGVHSGGGHSCGVRALDGGSLWCWGRNTDGQLGDGTATTRTLPTRVNLPLVGFVSAAVGDEHSCAVRHDALGARQLYCFGANGTAALGLGHTGQQRSPALVDESLHWQGVSLGADFTCGLGDGEILCWGSANIGQLGLGVVGRHFAMAPSSDLQSWSALSVGHHYTCGIQNDHSLWCWGANAQGRLGLGDRNNRQLPTQITGVGTDAWQSVALGRGDHTCAIQDNRLLWCWGWNNRGQLGINSTASPQETPQQVSGLFDDWLAVAVGETHTCGIRESDSDERTLWCFGDNRQGQLGVGDKVDRHVPTQVLLDSDSDDDWMAVSAGAVHTCALKFDGRLFCFGSNTHGRLGVAIDADDADEPSPQLVPHSDWHSVSLGANFSCGIRATGTDERTLWCFGNNTNRQLGHNATGHQTNAVQEATLAIDWAAVMAGHNSACGIRDDGSLWCWGQDNNDQLGLGGGNIALPTWVNVGSGVWSTGGTASDHGCGLRAGDVGQVLWCTGDNRLGQLGNGAAFRSEPTFVVEP